MEVERRYRVVGGVAAWRFPIAFGFLTAAAAGAGEWSIACVLAATGLVAHALEQGAVFAISPRGLTRGFVIGSSFVGPARIVPWASIVEIATGWRGGRDYTALETTVRSRDGIVLRFGSRMGLAAYQLLLAEVHVHAPATAVRSGLTQQVIDEARQPGFGVSPVWATALSVVVVLALLALAV
jgi:hypothetical protein